MSLICYADDAIYADRTAIVDTDYHDIHRYSTMNKTYVANNKTFAFVYSGLDLDRSSSLFRNVVSFIREKVKFYDVIPLREENIEKVFPDLGDCSFIVMTKRSVFFFDFDLVEGSKFRIRITKPSHNGVFGGSAVRRANAFYAAGFDIDTIYKTIQIVSDDLMPCPVDRISRHTLVEFPPPGQGRKTKKNVTPSDFTTAA